MKNNMIIIILMKQMYSIKWIGQHSSCNLLTVQLNIMGSACTTAVSLILMGMNFLGFSKNQFQRIRKFVAIEPSKT